MSNIRKSLLISFSQSYVLYFLQFITSVVIARLLTPAELGVFSIVAVLVMLGNTVRDFGVVDYVVQEQELTHDRIRSAIALTTLGAWLIAAIILVLSFPIAQFYRQEDIAFLLLLVSVNFLLLPFGSVIMANMRREMHFLRIAKIKVIVTLIQSGTGIILALLGFSYFSMAWAAVLATVATVAFAQYYRPSGFPILPGFKAMRRVFNFGSFSVFHAIMFDLQKGSPDLILGRTINMEAVAFFGRATGIIDIFYQLIVKSVSYVALPHYAAQLRGGNEILQSHLRSSSFVSVVLWPCYLFIGFAAEPLILSIYGHQWGPSVILVQIIVIGEMFMAPFSLQDQLFISKGLVKVEFYRSFFILILKIIPLVVLSSFGLDVVAQGYVASYIIASVISVWYLKQYFHVTLFDFFISLKSSLYVLFALLPIVYISSMMIEKYLLTGWLNIFYYAVAISIGWLVAIYLLKHPFRIELNSLSFSLWAKVSARFVKS